MKVNVELDGNELTKGLSFHGETYADRDVVAKLSELKKILSGVLFDLTELNDNVKSRSEASAKDIAKQLSLMELELGIKLDWEEK